MTYEEYLRDVKKGSVTDLGNSPVTPLLLMLQGQWKEVSNRFMAMPSARCQEGTRHRSGQQPGHAAASDASGKVENTDSL